MSLSASDSAELATLTHLSARGWQDLVTEPEPVLKMIVAGYAGLDWTQRPDVLGRVIEILLGAAQVAGAVSGIASAASAVSALRSL